MRKPRGVVQGRVEEDEGDYDDNKHIAMHRYVD